MRKVTVHDPVVVAQSTTAPILFGGYQDPFIRCNENKELFVRFNVRHDCMETFGEENTNPIYKSVDGGKTWELMKDPLYSWITAQKPLPNGDYLQLGERPIITEFPELPELPEERKNVYDVTGSRDVYLADELLPILGDKVAKEFKAYRIKAGTKEIVEETCKVNWDNMPVCLCNQSILSNLILSTGCNHVVDKSGTLWTVAFSPYIDEEGNLASQHNCTHVFSSDDMGHTWDYVSTIVYKEEYNNPNCIEIEGFNECALEILDDGTIFCVVRSGSLHPFKKGNAEHPAPKLYCVRSKDRGKTWEEAEVFYDYGILPQIVRLKCGTYLFSSGRPGVYIRSCNDVKAEEWSDIIPILTVPEEDVYEAYYEYSCCNTGLCAYDERTAFLVYSDFTLNAPDGKRAKSIVVRKITIDE